MVLKMPENNVLPFPVARLHGTPFIKCRPCLSWQKGAAHSGAKNLPKCNRRFRRILKSSSYFQRRLVPMVVS
jgi:hypothetical protein